MFTVQKSYNLNQLAIKSLTTCALIVQTYNMLQFYISVVTPLELIETVSTSAIQSYIKTRSKRERDDMLDPINMNKVIKSTEKDSSLKHYSESIKKDITKIYQNHLDKLEKGQKELFKDEALNNAFLSLHKLNHASVDRLCAVQLMNGKYTDYGLQILTLKNSLTSAVQTASSMSKKAAFLIGSQIGYTIATIENNIWYRLDKEDQDVFAKCIENFSTCLEYVSPAAYMAYNVYRVTSKIVNKGIQASFMPLNAITVLFVGFINGLLNINDGKQSDIVRALHGKTWLQLFDYTMTSSTGLCKNIINDFKTSYNFALTKQEKFLDVINKGGTESAIDIKPQKSSRDLLYLSVVSDSLKNDNIKSFEQQFVTTTFKFNAAYKAVLAVSAKNLYQMSQQVGQITGESVKFAINTVNNSIQR